MKPVRRSTRETLRHERAVVLQQIGEDSAAQLPVNDWLQRQKLECARMKQASRRLR